MANEILLDAKGISKSFPGVRALDNIDFSVVEGEVHSLMGENGAGKSTLIKVLTGIYQKDEGEILFNGKRLEPKDALSVQKAGISTIYQELNLIPYMSVAENIFLGREPLKAGRIDWKKINSESQRLMKELGINIDVKTQVNKLSTAYQQIAAIVRAISIDAKLVIMDEPTSSLNSDEVKVLFGIIRKLKDQGVAVIFIAHRLDEIFEICDRITILKDGQLVGTYKTEEMDHLKLVSSMIGRDATEIVSDLPEAPKSPVNSEMLLKAKNIKFGPKVQNVSVDIRKGESVGIAGMLGSGRTEFLKTLFGAESNYTGELEINGVSKVIKRPTKAIKNNIAFLSEDRKLEGIIPNMSVKENLSLVLLPKISRFGIVQSKKEEEIVNDYISRLKIKTPHMNQLIKNLSGGNQQKVLLARWLANAPDLIMLDEPTRGIDVGAKSEIENIIKEQIDKGISVLMVSSEYDEILRNCSKVVILRDGTSIAELRADECSEGNIINCIAAGKKVIHGGI
jgi:ABC-type sugar transport system ATPase subunit